MTHDTERLETAAGSLALVVAGIHLYWGIPRFAVYASVGAMPDPRPLAFVLSGHAIVLAITLVSVGVIDSRRTYTPGIVLMLTHVIAYAAWHTVLGHGIGATVGHAHDHAHGHVLVAITRDLLIVLEHLVNSPLAFVSKLAEIAVAVLLWVLSYADGRSA